MARCPWPTSAGAGVTALVSSRVKRYLIGRKVEVLLKLAGSAVDAALLKGRVEYLPDVRAVD